MKQFQVSNTQVGIVARGLSDGWYDRAHIVSPDCTNDAREKTLCGVAIGRPANDFNLIPGWVYVKRFDSSMDCKPCAAAYRRGPK